MRKFIKVKSIAELAKLREKCVFLAGGTDIYVALNDGALENVTLCDISSLPGLDKIEIRGGNIRIGALATFTSIAKSPVIKKYAACLAEAASRVGSPQIRNRATIGGNVGNGSPAGDSIPALYALRALIKTNIRSIPADKFFTGPKKTVLKKNELITEIILAKTNNRSFFSKIAQRKALAISKVSAAASLDVRGGVVAGASIAFGAVCPTVIRCEKSEKFLTGKKLTGKVIAEAAGLCAAEICPIDDFRSTAEYRRECAAVLISRMLAGVV